MIAISRTYHKTSESDCQNDRKIHSGHECAVEQAAGKDDNRRIR